MTRRAWLLSVIGVGLILAGIAATAPAPEPKFSVEQCRKIAAEFLGVPPGELTREGAAMLLERPTDLRPPVRVFVLPCPEGAKVPYAAQQEGRAWVVVDAWNGEVMAVEYQARRYEIGAEEISEEAARAAAQRFLKAQWRHVDRARFESASEPWRPGRFANPQTAPQQSFTWVVERQAIRVGKATLNVNLTTGEVLTYGQQYYPAEGLSPARVTKQQAINATLSKLADEQRTKAIVQEAFLATTWHKGEVRLAWVVYLKAPARMPPGYRMTPPMRTYGLQLDAHTGEVYMEVK